MSLQSPKVIISGGGTGGHIYPAIAIANAIKKLKPKADILFVGAKGRMEMEKVPEAGYPIEGLWISGLQRKLTLKNLSFPFKVIHSVWKSRQILKKFGPDVVVGTGGFASGPILRAATGRKIPTLIQEQNSFAGITNKLLAGKVSKICVAYDGMDRFFPKNKIVLSGNPVRDEVIDIEGKKEEALAFFKCSPEKPVILIVGGSLGSRAINLAIKSKLSQIAGSNVQLIWQTGKISHHEVIDEAKKYEGHGIHVHKFINRMDYAYAAADLVISRAGAIAVSELCLTGKPCILLPLPHAAENHQKKNAEALVNHNAALMVTDKEANEKLVPTALELVKDQNRLEQLGRNVKKLGIENSAQIIANEVIKLIAA